MKNVLIRLLRTGESDRDRNHMSSWRKAALILVFGAALAGQLWRFGDPYMLAYETGFQEMIARHHLQPGLSETHGISTITFLDPDPNYNPTHPPLLQLILAFLYWVFGDSEQTSRIVPLASFILSFWGLWRLTHGKISADGRLAVVMAYAFAPLFFFSGRVVNFEPPVVACVIWTAVLVEELNHSFRWSWFIGLGLLAVAGTLLDWPYPLFVGCLFVFAWFRRDVSKAYYRPVYLVWGLALTASIGYAIALYSIGFLDTFLHHATVQSGTFLPSAGYRLPPILSDWRWWTSLVERVFHYGSPALALTILVWCGWVVYAKKYREGLHHWCVVFASFSFAYLAIFSRGSQNHFWCLFYFAPLFCVAYGLILDRLRWQGAVVLTIILLVFSLPVTYFLRTTTPLLTSVQLGRICSAATDCLQEERRSAMGGPLLYTNRVDPMGYYAGCETAFFYHAVKVSLPDKFLIRYRPEFVAITQRDSKTAFTMRSSDAGPLYERLNKSYTKVYEQTGTQLWESLWSPHVSLMGLLHTPDGESPLKKIMDDGVEIHIGAVIPPGESALHIDLYPIRKEGRRWLHGWVMGHNVHSGKPVRVTVRNQNKTELGRITVVPQSGGKRWQEFWIYAGSRPEYLTFSYTGHDLQWGDLRLYSETLWTTDLTRALAGELQRNLHPDGYNETMKINLDGLVYYSVLQHPGMGVDRIEIPPVRIGFDQSLVVKYGIHPNAVDRSDGVDYRLYMRNHALGKRFLLFEDSLRPQEHPEDRTWRIRKIDLSEHSRHLLSFTFETGPGPQGDTTSDHALWYEARITPNR